jgi:farnesyl-diphosphate farnesyltransferase
MPMPRSQVPKGLLKGVSRSFYLTLHVLPSSIRDQIGLAYLLARASDTVADTRLIPVDLRLSVLREMRDAILVSAGGNYAQVPDFSRLTPSGNIPDFQGSSEERTLLANFHYALEALRCLSADDRQRIQDLLEKIIRGQELDLMRFGAGSADQITALETEAQLEEYEYLVAGCVGEFWTKMCLAHVIPQMRQKEVIMLKNGVRFGKGLQLVNILRDLPGDLRQGRCYLPSIRLSEHGLTPQMLLNATNMDCFRPIYSVYLKQAEEHLRAGWSYTNTIPRKQIRVRLACAWPILIGMKTLESLHADNVLNDQSRIKIGRSEVRSLILRSILYYPRAAAWERLVDLAKDQPS